MALRWAWDFYRQHLPLVLILGGIAAVERFTGQLWERPPAVGVITFLSRATLVVFAVSISKLGWPKLKAVLVNWVLISLAFLVFDVVPENVVPALIDVDELYWAFLLGIKNLTIIPFTFLWILGLFVQSRPSERARDTADERSDTPSLR